MPVSLQSSWLPCPSPRCYSWSSRLALSTPWRRSTWRTLEWSSSTKGNLRQIHFAIWTNTVWFSSTTGSLLRCCGHQHLEDGFDTMKIQITYSKESICGSTAEGAVLDLCLLCQVLGRVHWRWHLWRRQESCNKSSWSWSWSLSSLSPSSSSSSSSPAKFAV